MRLSYLIAFGVRPNDEFDRVEEVYQGVHSRALPDQLGRVPFRQPQIFFAPSTDAGAVRVNGVG